MRIVSFDIKNFRGIVRATAAHLGSTVIIAGQNGSGKSCIFDAIRLTKSAYGGYQQNEWHHWMGEFAINVNSSGQDLAGLFNNQRLPLSVLLNFELHDEEKAFLTAQADELLTEGVWRTLIPEAYSYGAFRMALFNNQFRQREPEVLEKVAEKKSAFLAELSQPYITASIQVQPGGRMTLRNSEVLPIIFMLYRPRELGLIDYHGPQRHYGREQVQNVNISLDHQSQVQSAHALYNYSNKYQNVKSEMAASYMREILAEQAGVPRAAQNSLTDTLKDLFETFFPHKKFLGPIPTSDGGLSFPVETGGGRHDLDDLSSGEKEILYGYLRIRNSAPRFSIILIDEPEIHLNPRLIRGLPQFYRKNLGVALDNQIWLVTHSDALLREAVGKDGFNVFHMQPCGPAVNGVGAVTVTTQQLREIDVKSDVDLALTDLVGDLAAYQPDAKVLIFEGGGDTDFDRWMTATLFPDFASSVNLISGGNKQKIRALHEVLNKAYEQGRIKTQFFAIVDGDYEDGGAVEAINRFRWPVYHIENFLLDQAVISQVISGLKQTAVSEEQVLEMLRDCARLSVSKAIRQKITDFANRELVRTINLAFDPSVENVSDALHEAVQRSVVRGSAVAETALSLENLRQLECQVKAEIEAAFGDGTWIKRLPGREILTALSTKLPNGIGYETLRNMIVNRMLEIGYKPTGMAEILREIGPGV